MKVQAGHTVRVEYELTVKGGEVIESSAKSGPVTYVHGEGKMLPGLEKRLEGMGAGETKTGTIPASEAFGDESVLPTREIARREFPAGEELKAGRLFSAKGPDGQPVAFRIVEVAGEVAKVRFLHPLRDKDLEFRVKVLLIDDPRARKRATIAPPPPPVEALEAELVADDGKPATERLNE